ncbi:MAG TPA: glycosyltransferase [Desulfomonilaceae bacterium]|nr:glycosyltransferase [Desulfomonilaceae bacterium]
MSEMIAPKITVLMSVYNGKTFLAEAVSSVLSQTFRDFEFLIIDDGSTEPVTHLIESFRDERIRIHTQNNIGLTRSLNRGLELARGDYVARMDADDVSLPGRLKAQAQTLDTDGSVDLVGTFFDVIDAEGNIRERKELIVDDIERLWRLQFHNNYGHGTIMMRKRAVINAGKYDETLRYAQDYDLWSRISTKRNTRIIPEPLYLYRMIEHGAQASVKNYDSQLATAIDISNRNLNLCNPHLTDEQSAEVRALYWKFQRDRFSGDGLKLLPDTMEGFCRRYGLTDREEARLAKRVALDLMNEAQISPDLPPQALSGVLTRFRRMAER